VSFKSVQEFKKNIIFRLLSSFHIWVHLGIISLFNIVQIQDATLILVHDCESFLTEVNSELVHFSSNSSQKFIIVDTSTSISIKDLEESLAVCISNTSSKISDCFLELLKIKIFRIVIISYFELFSKSNKTSCTS
jgi:uncharacterized membrane protein YbjE (DUF340 family)